jgi:Tfp pilus assembly protein PilX
MRLKKSLPSRALLARRGFALVITLSLMALLIVLAVGLMSLSAVSLRTSGRGDALAEARANARLALAMAMGELQQLAGPDTRTTASADLAGTATGDPAPAGVAPLNNTTINATQKGISAVQPGTRHWTGVWHQTAAATQIYTRTPSPVLLGWLVSGNENANATARLTPAAPVAAVDSSGAPADRAKAVVLVGAGSVGSGAVDRYVAAPLVELAGTSGSTPAGRHAWWIGDEGVKARFNHLAPVNPDGSLTYESMGARRAGWEAVDGFGAYPQPSAANAAAVRKVVTLPQAGLLDQAMDQAGTDGSPLERVFHAATTDSAGLLADSLNGGLRIDLTPYLQSGFPDAPRSTFPNSPSASAPLVPRTIARTMRAPTWNRLKEFADMVPPVGGSIQVKAASSDLAVAVAPVISELRLLFGVKLVAAGTDSYKVHPCVKVAVALANPYPYPLKWDQALELEFTNSQPSGTQGVPGDYQPGSVYDAAGRPAFVPATPAQPAALNNAVFRIPSDELAPGEARAYTMGSRVPRPANSTARVVVDLREFRSAQPANFDNCVELAHNSVNSTAGREMSLDMRESWTTTQISADLRLGSNPRNLLRRLERFELDNGYFATTTRRVSSAKAKSMSRPFPLQYYSFQLSQPGNDYRAILPSPFGINPLGLRGSTLRTFADFNFQAKRFHKAIACYNPPPYFMESADSFANLPFTDPGGDTGNAFTKNLAVSPLAWGRSPFATKKVVLFSPQRKFLSLAQLQHADLTGDDTFASVGHQPGNAVGNSYATPFVKRQSTIQQRNNFTITGVNSSDGFQTLPMNYYDLSYLLNAALWDSYYFSAIPATGDPLPENPALLRFRPDQDTTEIRDANLAAAHLFIDGAFNVNSTHKEAWKAILAGSKHLKHPADAAEAPADALYPRSLEQTSPAASPPTGHLDDSFSGFRRLTDDQLDAIATEITRQVRLRGPFLSLSHFVNRAIGDISRDKVLTRAGALQVALDESGANINLAGSKNIFNNVRPTDDRLNIQANGNAPRADLDGTDGSIFREVDPREPVWAPSSKDDNPGTIGSILADRVMLTNPRFRDEQGYRSTGIPGWITQADILQIIGPALASRSDTFRIRAYGEALDPEGNIIAKAWCEAVVQRQPEYIDPANPATDRAAALSGINQKFGRRFNVVAFRWLSPQEV